MLCCQFRQTGVPPDNLKSEEDTFHKLEMELVRGLRRVFRKGRGISLQQIGQILSPRPTGQLVPSKKAMSPSATLPRNRLVSTCVIVIYLLATPAVSMYLALWLSYCHLFTLSDKCCKTTALQSRKFSVCCLVCL